ncbi:hypothetical protein RYX36_016854 [Vicia faba]
MSPFISKMIATVLRRLRDPDSVVRSACVDAVAEMSSRITRPSFTVAFLRPFMDALTLEQDVNVQIGASLCLAAAIDAAPVPDVESLRRITLPRLGKLLKTDSCKAIAEASKEWGMFQILNHEIPNDVIRKLQSVGKEFFELPQEEKEVIAKPVGSNSIEGYGTSLQKEVNGKKAFIPDPHHKPSYVLHQYIERYPITGWLDSEVPFHGNKTLLLLGSKFLSTNFFQLCSKEDLELVNSLRRAGSLFVEDLSEAENFSKKGFESIQCVYIVANEDLAIPVEFQQWMIQNTEIDVVKVINGADHMAMLSKPQELCLSLLDIADKYA